MQEGLPVARRSLRQEETNLERQNAASASVISLLLLASVIALSGVASRHSTLPAPIVREVSAQEAQARMAVGAIVIDVREGRLE
jgi:hypothetical protein